jgi:hypothetical protein
VPHKLSIKLEGYHERYRRGNVNNDFVEKPIAGWEQSVALTWPRSSGNLRPSSNPKLN